MKVIFRKKENVMLRRGYQIIKKIKKQNIADFLMGERDYAIMCTLTENEKNLIMSFLPYLSSIGFEYPGYDLEKNQIIFWFESSSLCNPSPVILEVDDMFYKFLQTTK